MRYLAYRTGFIQSIKVTSSYQTGSNTFSTSTYMVDTPSISFRWNSTTSFIVTNTLPFSTCLYRPYVRFLPDHGYKYCFPDVTHVYLDNHTDSEFPTTSRYGQVYATKFDVDPFILDSLFYDWYMSIPNAYRITTENVNTSVYTQPDANNKYVNTFTFTVNACHYPSMPQGQTKSYRMFCHVLLDYVYAFADDDPNYDALKALYPNNTEDVTPDWKPTEYDWVMTEGSMPRQSGWKWYGKIFAGDDPVDAIYRGDTQITDVFCGNIKIQ